MTKVRTIFGHGVNPARIPNEIYEVDNDADLVLLKSNNLVEVVAEEESEIEEESKTPQTKNSSRKTKEQKFEEVETKSEDVETKSEDVETE